MRTEQNGTEQKSQHTLRLVRMTDNMPHHKDSEPGLAPCATPEYTTRRCPNASPARSSSLLLPLPAECGPVLSAIEISCRPFYGSGSKRAAVRDIPKPAGSRRRSTRPDPSTDGHHVHTRVAADCRAAAILTQASIMRAPDPPLGSIQADKLDGRTRQTGSVCRCR